MDKAVWVGDGAEPREHTGAECKMGWVLTRAMEHRVTAAEARFDHFEFEDVNSSQPN